MRGINLVKHMFLSNSEYVNSIITQVVMIRKCDKHYSVPTSCNSEHKY